jgi:hypothetical protein
LARLIFPELRDDFAVSIWDEPNSYAFVSTLVNKLDLLRKTKVGYFIVKDFGDNIVTFEDIQRLSTVCNKLRGKTPAKNIFRIICVAKNYDENFLDRESLEKLMTEKLQSDLKIDLLIKEPNGYSMLWIS